MPSQISPEDLDLLYPEDLDLYYVWNWDWSVRENVDEIVRWFPGLAVERGSLERLVDRALRGEEEPFRGEFYLRSGTEEQLAEAATRACALGVAYLMHRRAGRADEAR
ncbi:hypothetical protein [Nannocystis punicea]|uniref:Uncharacterized protein n=1 Tax=Nannocystis punicea TaxID=2995304 RepID=A0ABY7GYI8_9BACT|nr:hypothetical protein [Nannocystis poenicansa]WAS92052.1 hypothetical protein O0S08_38210 [Nannocystis poenicansa]